MTADPSALPVADPDDVSSNTSGNRPFKDVVATRMSRRAALRGGTAAAVGFMALGATQAAAAAEPGKAAAGRGPHHGGGHRPLLGFKPVPLHDVDQLTVPEGYEAQVLIPWGTPIRPGGPQWHKDASNTAAEQAQQLGMNHDGMHFFPLGHGRRGSQRGMLVLNHEYVDQALLFPDGPADMTPEKVEKALAAHGVSIVEVARKADGSWERVASRRARKVHGATPVTFSGPVPAHHPELQANNPPMGTLNNCSMGVTPWGTYLACEENWNSYFGTEDASWQPTEAQARYGLNTFGFGYRWHLASPRWDVAVNGKEANRFGWVVEIDPMNPRHTPVKRTALGRIKHEGCVTTECRGRVVGYMGDDQNGDYIYKFVGRRPWRSYRRGQSPLDDGTLYVARFDDDGKGCWLPLVFGKGPLTAAGGWKDQADVLLRTREAADALGATPMDRPEWLAVNPKNKDVYCTLTNGSGEGGAANPRTPNPYGHIIRWRENGGDNTATAFCWDIFQLAGDPAYDDAVDLTEETMFGSPDGLWFDADARLWIQTDISNSAQNLPQKGYDRLGNNAMLAADPRTGEIRRFLVGPRGCEITGVVTTPDQRTMFVNIQHPGEATVAWGAPTPENPRAVSNWPDYDPDGRPRSATVVIRRTDGGKIGA
ncbi:PhoX family protein [Streptomyces apocyni]|uniref:PhoX family protein n=1 Tax=Streptomyces apocyni TaxID=2654677 RepID=UPI0012EA1C16|nr:PhoX family phosphatase [Streptomyces apocyni]